MRRILFISLSFFMCLVFAPTAMARVQASVDRVETGPGESILLTVSVKGGAADVDTSAIRDFKIVSTSTSSSIQISGQNYERKTEYIYTLIPLTTGKAIIPPLEVNVDGKTFATKEITVRVSEEKQTKNQKCL